MKKDLQFIDQDQWKEGESIPLPHHIELAIKCADMSQVDIRNWRPLETSELTKAEKAMRWLEMFCIIPAGNMTGEPLRLMLFQEVLFYLMFDISGVNTIIVSMARRCGKSFIQASVALLQMVSMFARQNDSIGCFAMSREQASIIFKYMTDMVNISPSLVGRIRATPSTKKAVSISKNVEFKSNSADAKSGLGHSYRLAILDEAGQVKLPTSDYVDMIRSSQGSYDDARFISISTQAPSDTSYLSTIIDSSIKDQPNNVVCVVFETPEQYAFDDPDGWIYSNPSIGVFRSYEDVRLQADAAKRIPANEPGFCNLILNRRTASESLFLSATVWKSCGEDVDMEVFKDNRVIMGLDLSARADLTAAVIAAKDNYGRVHVFPFVFCPTSGIEARQRRDKAPYKTWVDRGFMIPIGGKTMDYDQISEYLRDELERLGILVDEVAFDRWKMLDFKAACDRNSAFQESEFVEVGQGFKDMGVRCDSLLNSMLEEKIVHGNHPLLTMAASNAIAVRDPTNSVKLDKSKSTARIDPLVAMLMACYPLLDGDQNQDSDVSHWIM